MLTRKELCQIFLIKAQQKFGKPMTELDIYYAGAEVGIALSYLGLIQDQSSLYYVKGAPCPVFKHPNGKELNYFELLGFLPEENTVVKKEVKEIKNQVPDAAILLSMDEDQIKELLGDRKYFRISDAIETLKGEELVIVAQLLKLRFEQLQSPAT